MHQTPAGMRYSMFFLIGCLLFFTACQESAREPEWKPRKLSPGKGTKLFVKQFDWSITMPPGFKRVKKDTGTVPKKKSAKPVLEREETNASASNITPLFSFENNEVNVFEAFFMPYNTDVQGNYLWAFQMEADNAYRSFQKQFPDATLDSALTRELIDGLTFQSYNLTVKVTDIMTLEKEKKEELVEALMSSKFDYNKE
jgi:hypothetical protein